MVSKSETERLIPAEVVTPKETPATPLDALEVDLPVDMLDLDPGQPRRELDPQSLQELQASLETHGQLSPLVVRPMAGPQNRGKYWVVAGGRRLRAARQAGWSTIRCSIRPYSNAQARIIGLVENIHRDDLTDMEKSDALVELKRTTDKTWQEIAQLVHLSESRVLSLAGLQKLEEPVKEMVRRGELPGRTAVALRPLPATQQRALAERVVQQRLTAEDVRGEISERINRPGTARSTFIPPTLPTIPDEARGRVVQTMNAYTGHLQAISAWLEERDWAPSKVTPGQREAVLALYQAASQLQQQLIYIKNGLRGTEEPVAAGANESTWPF